MKREVSISKSGLIPLELYGFPEVHKHFRELAFYSDHCM